MNLFFRAVLGSVAKWNRRERDFPYSPCPQSYIAPALSVVLYQSRVIHLLQLLYLHWHIILTQSPWFYIMVQSWCSVLGELWQMHNERHVSTIIRVYRRTVALSCKSSVLHLFLPPFPKHLSSTDPLTVFIVLSVPECHIIGILQQVASSDWLLSLGNTHWRFFCVFSWLDCSVLFSTG